MKGVSMVRAQFRAHAYCLGIDGGEDGGPCPFQRRAGLTMTAAEVRNEAQRHVQRTGHEVNVDVVDHTSYTPEPVAAPDDGNAYPVSYLACGDQVQDAAPIEPGTHFHCQRHGETRVITADHWLANTPAEPAPCGCCLCVCPDMADGPDGFCSACRATRNAAEAAEVFQ